jgi:Uncharacterised nucleotidyltransferase
MLNLSTENRLLLCCSQLKLAEAAKNEMNELIRRPMDWNSILESAHWHGVAPLVYKNLIKCGLSSQVPNEIIKALKSTYRKQVIRNTLLFAELDRLLAAFEQSRIPIIPLKGVVIARLIYKDIGLRPMSDIDVLVKRSDISRAMELMPALGYRQHGKENLIQLLDKRHHVVYLNLSSRIPLEIHWDIDSQDHPALIRPTISNLMEIWWARARGPSSDYRVVSYLHPIDLICHLSTHFFKHRFINQNAGFVSSAALIQLCDIYNVVDFFQAEIDWDQLKVESQKIGIYQIVSATLSIVKEIFCEGVDHSTADLPAWEIASSDRVIISYVKKRIFLAKDKHSTVSPGFIKAQNATSKKMRFKHIVKAIFPSPQVLSDKLKKPINSKLFYLNYLVRPFIILKKYGKSFFEIRRLKEEGILKKWIDAQD